MMGVKQFNASYDKQEDRIFFRFNTQEQSEFRFWLTLFITKNILSAIDQLVTKSLEKKHNAQIAQVIHEFQDEAIAKTTDLKAPYEGAQTFPLGEAPILVTGFSVAEKDEIFFFTFNLIGGKSVNMQLPATATQSMALLLRTLGSANNHWHVGFELPVLDGKQENLDDLLLQVTKKQVH
jgi:hypothetical protein